MVFFHQKMMVFFIIIFDFLKTDLVDYDFICLFCSICNINCSIFTLFFIYNKIYSIYLSIVENIFSYVFFYNTFKRYCNFFLK